MLISFGVHVQREIYETKWVDSFRDFAVHIRMQTIRWCNLSFYSTGLVFLPVPAQNLRINFAGILFLLQRDRFMRRKLESRPQEERLMMNYKWSATNGNSEFTLASASSHLFLLNLNGKRKRMSQWFCGNKPCIIGRAKRIKFLLQSASKFYHPFLSTWAPQLT